MTVLTRGLSNSINLKLAIARCRRPVWRNGGTARRTSGSCAAVSQLLERGQAQPLLFGESPLLQPLPPAVATTGSQASRGSGAIQPWEKSTGPKTPDGKAKAARSQTRGPKCAICANGPMNS